MIDPVLRDLGDMHHAFLARRKLDEGAEFLDGNDGTGKDHAFLEIGRDDADHLDGLVDRVQIRTAYADGTVILDIDGSAGAGDDLIDRLASLTDHIADLHRINGDLDNLRRVLGDFRSRLRDARKHHFVQDILTGFLRAGDRFLNDRTGQAVNLDIHLDRGDAVMRAGDLEVHVAEEVLKPLDIRQDDVVVIGLARDQAAGDAGDRPRALPELRVRSHGVPVLWTAWSHRPNRTGNYTDEDNASL